MGAEAHGVAIAESSEQGTEYIVLARSSSEAKTWAEVGRAWLKSSDAAIREVVGRLDEDKRRGTFIAVPARSFKPVTVSEKVERTLVIGA